MRQVQKVKIILLAVVCGFIFTASNTAFAASMKIGVFNLQQILSTSKAGKAAASRLKSKASGYEKKFKADQNRLIALENSIKKKSSAWSQEKKATEVRKFRKAQREYKEKAADAAYELKKEQDKALAPLMKTLKGIISSYAAANGYTLIIEKMPGVAYFHQSIDISADLTRELDKKMK